MHWAEYGWIDLGVACCIDGVDVSGHVWTRVLEIHTTFIIRDLKPRKSRPRMSYRSGYGHIHCGVHGSKSGTGVLLAGVYVRTRRNIHFLELCRYNPN